MPRARYIKFPVRRSSSYSLLFCGADAVSAISMVKPDHSTVRVKTKKSRRLTYPFRTLLGLTCYQPGFVYY